MGTGYTRNDTLNNIADGNIINASDIDGEYDAIEAAFNETTGHTHDGTAAEGAPVTVLGPVQDFIASATEIKPKTTNTLDIGTNSLQFKDMYLDGTAYIDGLGEDILVATDKKVQFRDTALFINSSADGQLDIDADVEVEITAPTLDIDASTAVTIDTTTLTITGSANVVGDLDVDNININGNTIISTDTDGDINISPDGTGTVVIDTDLDVDNINVNGNTVSSTDTNGNINLSPNGTGTVVINTDLDVDNININGNTIISTDTNGDINISPDGTGTVVIDTDLDVDNININGNTIISTDTNGNIALTPNGTGEVDISKVDIASGEIDGTTIGANSAAAGTFTTLSATTLGSAVDLNSQALTNVNIDSGAIDGVTIGTNSAVTEAQVDNININGNTISSTDTNGDITLAPDGTGVVDVTGTVAADELKLQDDTDTNSIKLQAPSSVTTTTTFTLPDGDGNADQVLKTDGSGQLGWADRHANPSLIINGAMTVAQRGTSVSGLTDGGSPYQTVDRFRFVEQGSPTYVLTMSQSSTAPAGFANSLKLDITTAQGSLAAADALAVDTLIEGQNLQQLAYGTSSANTATLSFWVRSSKTGTYVVYFYQYDDDRATTHSYTINSADTWEYKTIVVPADTVGIIDNDNGRGIAVRWVLASGTNYTSGTASTAWAADVAANSYAGLNVNLADNTANDWYITGVKLEVGSTATDFFHRSYGEELALCQRYYYQVNTVAGGNLAYYHSYNDATKMVSIYHPVTMRSTPTATVTGDVGTEYQSHAGHYQAFIAATSNVTKNLDTVFFDAEL